MTTICNTTRYRFDLIRNCTYAGQGPSGLNTLYMLLRTACLLLVEAVNEDARILIGGKPICLRSGGGCKAS